MLHSKIFALCLLTTISSVSCQPVEDRSGTSPSVVNADESFIASGIDKSPMDMIYYPSDYPKLKMSGADIGPPVVRVIYSRPKKDGRDIFGGVIKYGNPWRLGANEATEIEFFQPVRIQGKTIPQERFILYCKPYPDRWVLMLNREIFSWGLRIDSSKDAFQFTVPVTSTNTPVEYFTMDFEPTDTGASLQIGWDDTRVALPIEFLR